MINKAENKKVEKSESNGKNAIAQNKKLFLIPSDGENKAKAVYANDITEAEKLSNK